VNYPEEMLINDYFHMNDDMKVARYFNIELDVMCLEFAHGGLDECRKGIRIRARLLYVLAWVSLILKIASKCQADSSACKNKMIIQNWS
jgi:hypothetical protein